MYDAGDEVVVRLSLQVGVLGADHFKLGLCGLGLTQDGSGQLKGDKRDRLGRSADDL